MIGLGIATDALVNDGIVRRTRDDDRVVIDTPSRRDFWFGHGFVLDAPPDITRVAALVEEGRARFAVLGAPRFVVQWERAYDAPDPVPDAPAGTLRERGLVMAYDGLVPHADRRVVDHDAARWDEAAALASEQYPEFGDFTRWRFDCVRRDARAGRARVVGIREDDRLLTTVGLYRGDGIARFMMPVTRPAARGRGLFAACARTLIAWANTDAPRRVVIVSDPDDGPVALYRRLGFVPASHLDAVIVPVPAATPGETSPPVR
ncbi:MAG: GNAT family N-acetyltransferase [Candidatus Eremiobacteraeota bacterium]|nr:GNAT family N-acetyltransferase [Candidatus Eremiobacteraeota bacterium]